MVLSRSIWATESTKYASPWMPATITISDDATWHFKNCNKSVSGLVCLGCNAAKPIEESGWLVQQEFFGEHDRFSPSSCRQPGNIISFSDSEWVCSCGKKVESSSMYTTRVALCQLPPRFLDARCLSFIEFTNSSSRIDVCPSCHNPQPSQ